MIPDGAHWSDVRNVTENIGEALDRMGVKTQETGFSGGCHVGSTTK